MGLGKFTMRALAYGPTADSRRLAPLVAVLQTSHPRQPHYAGASRRLRRDAPRLWRILLQAQMTTVLVIISDELAHEAVKLPLVEDNYFVQQSWRKVPPNRSTYGFCHGDRGAVRTGSTPKLWSAAGTS